MPAKITAGDAYHKLKLRWPDCLLAFGVGFMIEFVRSDAREVARLLQEPVDNPAGYDSVVIHSGKFFIALRRLNLMGKSVALFSRQTTPKGRNVFVFERRFDPVVPSN